MPVRKYKPTSPGRRFMSVSTFDEITKTEPEKSLVEPLKKSGGRNAYGRITRRHQGGGHKRRYRKIDFKRVKDGVPAKVAAIEYDPNRSARIALLHYADGAKAYILAPARLQVGATVYVGRGGRTNGDGIRQLRRHLAERGRTVVPVPRALNSATRCSRNDFALPPRACHTTTS